jgi:aminopeptidase N
MVLLQRRPPLLRRSLRDDPASFPDEPDFFLAHELAHQWWGQAVAGANYRERWLSEGFAQYAAALWVRESRGEVAFRKVLERFSRWALRYEDEGPIHLGYRVGHIEGDAQAFRSVIYDKAAYVLHMLDGVVGDLAFSRGLRAYQDAHRYAKAGADDLREALEAASGRDLRAYFAEWIFGTAIARMSYKAQVESANAGGYQVALVVRASGLPGPVPVEVRLKSGTGSTTTHVVQVATGETRATLTSDFRPTAVELNGDRGLLARVSGR